jgi:diguanylate cyclase (GGDEF)-like protein/PAS domain S-box-containing protein
MASEFPAAWRVRHDAAGIGTCPVLVAADLPTALPGLRQRDRMPFRAAMAGILSSVPHAAPAAGESMTATLPPFADVLNLLPDAVCVVDVDGHYLFVSASFERILGYGPGEVLGRRAFEFVHPDDVAATMQQAGDVVAGTMQRHFRNRYIHKDGHSVDIQWSAHWLPDYGVRIGVGREITELRRAERELEYLASHDALTGLPNRHRLQLELRQQIDNAIRTGGTLALLYLDLDGFKAANDRSGHLAGDGILRDVAQRLQQGLRQSDLVARVGGDEFVVLLPGCRGQAAARIVAEGLRARLLPPYLLPDGPMQLDASVGIACFPVDGTDPEALLAHADRKMYAAKRNTVSGPDARVAQQSCGDAAG